MKITRRRFLSGTSATIGASALPVWAHASFTMGDVQIDTLSDGNLLVPKGFIYDLNNEPELDEILARHGIVGDELTPDCNLTLMRDGTNTVIFDAGAGANFMPSAGKLWEAMDAIDLDPAEVTHVVFTHAHPDHLWGVLDDFDDFVFPNASYMIGRKERDFWLDPTTPDKISPERLAFVAGAVRYLGAIDDKLQTFEDGEEILPGIAARATYGHSPGHMAFEINAGTESVMVLGDCIRDTHVSIEKPGWTSTSDQDPDMAAQTRISLLDQLAHDQMAIIGFHMAYPGIGRIEKAGERYRFVPG